MYISGMMHAHTNLGDVDELKQSKQVCTEGACHGWANQALQALEYL